MTKYLVSGELSEDSIQTTVFEWIKWHPLLKKIVIHIPNEGKRTPSYGRKLKLMGMRGGVWDVLIACARHGYIGAWVELKSRDGKLSKAQVEFGKDMQEQNYFCKVCYSVDEAIDNITWYCLDK